MMRVAIFILAACTSTGCAGSAILTPEEVETMRSDLAATEDALGEASAINAQQAETLDELHERNRAYRSLLVDLAELLAALRRTIERMMLRNGAIADEGVEP